MNEKELHEWTQSGGINDYVEIARTWLEVNAFGQVRDQRTKEWFGDVVYRDDLAAVVTGQLPAYDPYVLLPTTQPNVYFRKRNREELDEDETTYPGRHRSKAKSAEEFFRPKPKPKREPEPRLRRRTKEETKMIHDEEATKIAA